MNQFENNENNTSADDGIFAESRSENPDNAAQGSANWAETAPKPDSHLNSDGGVFGEKSFGGADGGVNPYGQTPQYGQYTPPPQYNGYNSRPSADMQYGNMYSQPQYGGYREYNPNPAPNNNYNYGNNSFQSYQGNNYQGYAQPNYNAMPRPADIPPVSDIPQAEIKKTSKGWIIAIVAVVVVLVSAVMLLLAMSHSGDKADVPAEKTAVSEAGGSGVTVSISVQPKPVENEEYYQNKETGLLTPVGAAKQVLPSIVNLYGYTNTIITPYSEASGVIISEDGYIITNAHAVEEMSRVKVKLSDDREFEAEIIGFDTKTDLAVLKIEADDLTPAVIGSADALEQGEQVVAIGNAGGYNNTVTTGCVSHKDRTIKSYTGGDIECVQTDAVLNFGNSGGALINLYGQVVGIVTSKYSSTGDERVGFAIKTDFAVPIVEDIIESGYVTGRPRVGVTYTLITAEMAEKLEVKPGMLIDEVSSECDISNTKLQKDDIITSLDGVQILTDADIKKFQATHKPGDIVTAEVYRKDITGNTEEFEITFTLEEKKD